MREKKEADAVVSASPSPSFLFRRAKYSIGTRGLTGNSPNHSIQVGGDLVFVLVDDSSLFNSRATSEPSQHEGRTRRSCKCGEENERCTADKREETQATWFGCCFEDASQV